MVTSPKDLAREVEDHPVLEVGARAGYAANGLLHLLIAWIALQISWSQTSQDADQTGALAQLAGTPLGSLTLWAVAVGFGLLGLWQVTEAVGRRETSARLKAVGRAATYLALMVTAISVVQGSSSSSSDRTASMSAQVMQHAWGRVAVVVVGLAILGVAGHHLLKGLRKTFLKDLREHPGTAVVATGRVGYVVKAVALAIVGVLFISAALTADPDKARGLDGALRSLLGVPLGKVLVTVIAAGFAAYGVYSFVRARYARV